MISGIEASEKLVLDAIHPHRWVFAAAQDARLAAHQQGAYLVLSDRRKDFAYRV